MKYFFICLSLILIISCTDEPKHGYVTYSLSSMEIVPKEHKINFADCVANIMKGASNSLTTSDYEDVDDSIEIAHESCSKIFKKTIVCLKIYIHDERGEYNKYETLFYDPDDLKGHYLNIYNELLNTTENNIREELK